MLTRSPILATRDGRLFIAAQALDALAMGVSGVALPWLVLQQGGSHTVAGLVYTVTVLPYVAFGLTAGSVGDRFERRTVMVWGHAAQAACAAVIPAWTVAGSPPVGVVLVAAFAVGSGRVFVDAAAFGAVATIVGAERFVEGQAAVSAAWSIGFFAGPALAGGLVSAIGPGRALAAEAGALAFAALLVGAIRTSLARGERPSHAGAVQEGIRFIAGNRAIATYTGVIIVWNVVGGGALALEVPLLRDSVGLSSGEVGFILATGSLAALAGSVFATGLSRRFGARTVLRAGFLAIPIAVATLGAAAGFAVALVGTVGYLMAEGVTTVLSISERQRRTPDRLQGRVGIAGRMVALGAVAVGSALASALTRAVTVGHVYLLMGAAMLVVGVAATPLLLRLDD